MGGDLLPYRTHPQNGLRAPGAWTQTPISIWLPVPSVPIVPVSRNDYCLTLCPPFCHHFPLLCFIPLPCLSSPPFPLSFLMFPRSYIYFVLIPYPSMLLPSSLSHPTNFGRAEFSDFGLLVHRLWAKVHQVNVTHCTVIVPTH